VKHTEAYPETAANVRVDLRREWAELSDDLTTWTLPGERTKNGAAHMVPLSAPACELLRSLLPDNTKGAARALAERRASGVLALPGLAGTSLVKGGGCP
jgi:hypothetical protein